MEEEENEEQIVQPNSVNLEERNEQTMIISSTITENQLDLDDSDEGTKVFFFKCFSKEINLSPIKYYLCVSYQKGRLGMAYYDSSTSKIFATESWESELSDFATLHLGTKNQFFEYSNFSVVKFQIHPTNIISYSIPGIFLSELEKNGKNFLTCLSFNIFFCS